MELIGFASIFKNAWHTYMPSIPFVIIFNYLKLLRLRAASDFFFLLTLGFS